jgi:hypothetical protein
MRNLVTTMLCLLREAAMLTNSRDRKIRRTMGSVGLELRSLLTHCD